MPIEHQNVHGQKIGIKYFLEKRLKTRRTAWGGDGVLRDGYPVYVQVSAKQQNTKIRSKLNDFVAPEDFEVYLRRPDKQQIIEDEKEAVMKFVLAAKPFDNQHFSLSAALREFTDDEYDVSFVVGSLLKKEFKEAYKDDLVNRLRASYDEHPTKDWEYWAKYNYSLDEDDQQEYLVTTDARQILEAFDNPFAPYAAKLSPRSVFLLIWANAIEPNTRLCEMKARYGLPFLRLDLYMRIIRDEAKRLPTFELFLSPDFDKLFLKHCSSKDDLEALRTGFQKATERHPELLKVAQKY